MTSETPAGPEDAMERSADELAARVEQLGDHLDEARESVAKRAEEARGAGSGVSSDAVGDWEDTDDGSRGDDPSGAVDEDSAAAD